jgi:hypothetical protein
MTPQALRALAEIVEARKARDLARLERLLAEDRGLSREIEALAATATRDLAEGASLPLPRQGVRLAWADARIRAARRRREVLAEEIRAARAEAVRSLGKHTALEHLAGRADREELRVRTSRAEREAPPPVRAGDG